ncbi:MAG: site-specific integrase [Deltaproteobacteria bacterium]|nr:site-specific integrase [Deltaproteobacteria bacterium]
MKPTDLSICLTNFLSKYLPSQRNTSANTIKAYRDAFTLLLRFCRDIKGMSIERIYIEDITPSLVVEFLEYLEQQRLCIPRTRNQRLAAIRSFFRYLQTEKPEMLTHCQRILSIPSKRHKTTPVKYLSVDETKTLLSQPDTNTGPGQRDTMILSLLYDTAARVQELIDLTAGCVRLDEPAQIRITGKGRKVRIVPLMEETAESLKSYMHAHGLDQPEQTNTPLFSNRQGKKFTRSGIQYILSKYVSQTQIARRQTNKSLSPHTLRHTKAMHMMQLGIPPAYIRDFLGHSDTKTTRVYAKANIEMRRRALEKASVLVSPPCLPEWKKDKDLLEWLRSL